MNFELFWVDSATERAIGVLVFTLMAFCLCLYQGTPSGVPQSAPHAPALAAVPAFARNLTAERTPAVQPRTVADMRSWRIGTRAEPPLKGPFNERLVRHAWRRALIRAKNCSDTCKRKCSDEQKTVRTWAKPVGTRELRSNTGAGRSESARCGMPEDVFRTENLSGERRPIVPIFCLCLYQGTPSGVP